MTTTAVEWAATREAEALGHHWMGEEHLLLAVADEAGCDRNELVTALADRVERYGPPVPKVRPPPWLIAARSRSTYPLARCTTSYVATARGPAQAPRRS